ncbi:MAG: class I tRNA ligase family protein, partial [Chitinivibrionales bacterium]|nr:class I tRNA ligase family protein [Chitinivibrionales bacterium]
IQLDRNDIHRHSIDVVDVCCPKCGKPGMKRTPEVLDCWFESGSMPYGQNHYPFENREQFEKTFPAEFIAEGIDQTRGWFYTLTVLSSALFHKEAFKNVIVNGIVLAEDGKKLSKRLKNYTPVQEVLEKFGADALRLFLINSPAVRADDLRFSDKGVTEIARAILLPFWNAYAFFVTYATVDNWKPHREPAVQSSNELDLWIVSLLNHCIASVVNEMKLYNLYRVVPLLVDFIENLTNWYIRRSRRRFWRSENDADKMQAYETLYSVLVEFSKVMAPFLPFLTEAIYRNLVCRVNPQMPESIHLTAFPAADDSRIKPLLEQRMELVRRIVAMGRLLRSRHVIKNRQPLSALTVVIGDAGKLDSVAVMESLIREELNVKKVILSTNEDALVSLSAKPNYRTLGKIYGKAMKDAASLIEQFDSQTILSLQQGGRVSILDKQITFSDIEVRRIRHEGLQVETDADITVALNTEITPELLAEGYSREFINRIQNLRKSLNFAVADRIELSSWTGDEELKQALQRFSELICSETLSQSLRWDTNLQSSNANQSLDIEGKPIQVSISRVGA